MALEIDRQAFENQQKALQALISTDPEMKGRLREHIFQELKQARSEIVRQIKFANGDPRHTASAVKRYVAKKYLGGVVSIAGNPSDGGSSSYEPPRKLRQGQRGGNRRERGPRTKKMLSYTPSERQFILRFVDAGTRQRYANGRNGRWSKSGINKTFEQLQKTGTYNRGSIAPRNFFSRYGQIALDKAVQNLSSLIDEEFNKLTQE